MRLFYTFAFLVFSFSVFSQSFHRLTDTQPGAMDGISEDVRILTTFDNSIIYQDEVGDIRKIFVSDGTEEGSKEIMDLGSGGWIRTMYPIGDYIYANGEVDSLEEQQLFKISKEDFSTEIVLKDWESIYSMQAINGILYFNGEEQTFDQYFYKYTPETGLAEQVFEVYWFGGIEGFHEFNGEIYVMHWNESDDMIHLSKTNGEVGNKQLIKKFPDNGVYYSLMMTPADDYMFFWFRNGDNYYSLYKTDGTEEGTKVLNSDFEDIPFYDFGERRGLTTIGNKLLYRARLKDSGVRPEFYATDADTETTVKINIAMDDEIEAEPEFFIEYNGKTYVRVIYEQFWNSSYGIYETNGTLNGTKAIHDYDQLPEGYYSGGFWMTVFNDKIFHTAWTDEHGRELWSSMGTTNSNQRLTDIATDDQSPSITHLTPVGDNLFFFAEEEEFGRELYVYRDNIISTKDRLININVDLFPNPADDFIQIQNFELFRNKQYSISNITGEMVAKGVLQNNSVSIQSISKGVYFLNIDVESGTATKRFVKM